MRSVMAGSCRNPRRRRRKNCGRALRRTGGALNDRSAVHQKNSSSSRTSAGCVCSQRFESVLVDAQRGQRIIFRETKCRTQWAVHAEDAGLLHRRQIGKDFGSGARSATHNCGSMALTAAIEIISRRFRPRQARRQRIKPTVRPCHQRAFLQIGRAEFLCASLVINDPQFIRLKEPAGSSSRARIRSMCPRKAAWSVFFTAP